MQHPPADDHFYEGQVQVEIRLLGGFRVSFGTQTIADNAWRLTKARSIVKLLALTPGNHLPREQILDLLWPELDTQAAANNFHRAVHYARRALTQLSGEQVDFLRLSRGVLTLAPAGTISIDVEAFERAARTAQAASVPDDYETALDLYHGTLLPEDPYEEWTANRRRGLSETWLTLLLNLARIYEKSREFAAAQRLLRQVLENEPAHEDAHAGLMRIYALAGQRHQALRQYDHLTESLRYELDAPPSEASQRLYRDIVDERFPVSHTLPMAARQRRKTNLPSLLTSFVGREDACELIVERAISHRLVTLTGPGGIGKTRLALEAATWLTDRLEDGIWYVDLANINDSKLLVPTILSMLGVPEIQEQSLRSTLQAFLATRRLLLILDNCDHLIESAADLAHGLLQACPYLHILATSRETLRVAGECSWSIPPLSTPDPETQLSLPRLLEYEAIQLFIDRVQERNPAFTVDEERARSIASICHQLAGIPLAIELAAARTRTLSVAQIASRPDNALRLYANGPRTGPARQRSLESTIDWSYQLLPDVERRVFRRLAVFAGGWSLSAAESVCADETLTANTILNVLDSLVDKSLVTIDNHDNTPRYRMLEPVRQFAWERLQESGDADITARQHVNWCLALTSEAATHAWSREQTLWVSRLAAELDNLRAALDWTLEHDVETSLTLAGKLWWFWRFRSDFREGRHWLEAILDRTTARTATEAKGLLAMGTLAMIQGDLEWAEQRIEESLHIFRATGDQRFIGWALAQRGYIDLHSHRADAAQRSLNEGLDLLRSAGDWRGVGWTLAALGDIAAGQNQLAVAGNFYEERLNLHREHGDAHGIGWALLGKANVARTMGNAGEAQRLLQECLIVARNIGDKWAVAWALSCQGVVALMQENIPQARDALQEGLRILQDLGDRHGRVYSLYCHGLLMAREGDHRGAVRVLRFAESQPRPLDVWLTPPQLAESNAALQNAREILGDDLFARITDEARLMTMEQAIACALGNTGAATLFSGRLWYQETNSTTASLW